MLEINLLPEIPHGYVAGQSVTIAGSTILKLVPEGETAQDWNEMITMQVMSNDTGFTLEGFRYAMEMLFYEALPGSRAKPIENGQEEGTPTMIWSQSCLLNSQTGRPEMHFFKAVVRDDDIVVLEKAFKFEPTPRSSHHVSIFFGMRE